MAYRYRTNGTAALKPEELATVHQTPIIDFDSLNCGIINEDAQQASRPRFSALQRLHNDPLLGSLGHAFETNPQGSALQRKYFALAFSATFLLFLAAILLGA